MKLDLDLLRARGALLEGHFRLTSGLHSASYLQCARLLMDPLLATGNSAAAGVLLRLARFTGEAEYEEAGLSALRLVLDGMRRAPTGFGHALCALDFAVGPVKEVAIIGDPSHEETLELVRGVRTRFRPNVVLAVAGPGDADAADPIPLLRDRPQIDGKN